MTSSKSNEGQKSFKYPGTPEAMDGSEAVVWCETNASEAAGAYPITPSTQMGEGWALAQAAGIPKRQRPKAPLLRARG